MRRLTARMVGAVRALACRGRAERELDDELRAYLDEAVEQKQAAGMSRDEAIRAARVEMGSAEAIKEAVRDVGWESRLDSVVRDVRFACRTLRNAPKFTAVALVTLALGIGANTAIYSAIDAVFFRPLPFPNPEQIVNLRPVDVRVPQTVDTAPIGTRPVFVTDLHEAPEVFAHAAGYATGGLNLGSGPAPRRVAATFVTTEFFQLFGREPQIGRTFAPAEMHPGGPDVAVLSHGLWQTQFGGEPSIVGQTVRLDDRPFIVVGIMPPDFRFPVQADLWLPLPHPVPRWTSNTFRNYFPGFAVARLAPGVTPEQATARLDGIRRPWVDSQSARGLQVTPASELLTPLQRHLAGNRDTAFALMVLMPIQYEPQAYLSIVARGTGPDSLRALLADIRAAVTTIDPTLPVFNAQSLATAAGATIEARRINTLLISVFGVLALALAVIGVYGLLAYVVAQRTRELGIRIALGAQPAHLRHAVMRQGLALVAIGLTLGAGAAFLTTRYLESMLYGITPRDPGAFAGVVLLFAAATAVACYLPARRATRVDPIVALRMET